MVINPLYVLSEVSLETALSDGRDFPVADAAQAAPAQDLQRAPSLRFDV